MSKHTYRRWPHLILAALILAIEVAIALTLHSGWIRSHGGDLLASALVYFLFRGIFGLNALRAAGAALALSFAIEGLQSVDIVEVLGLQNNSLASTLVGRSFDPMDLLMYAFGVLLAILIDPSRGTKTKVSAR